MLDEATKPGHTRSPMKKPECFCNFSPLFIVQRAAHYGPLYLCEVEIKMNERRRRSGFFFRSVGTVITATITMKTMATELFDAVWTTRRCLRDGKRLNFVGPRCQRTGQSKKLEITIIKIAIGKHRFGVNNAKERKESPNMILFVENIFVDSELLPAFCVCTAFPRNRL